MLDLSHFLTGWILLLRCANVRERTFILAQVQIVVPGNHRACVREGKFACNTGRVALNIKNAGTRDCRGSRIAALVAIAGLVGKLQNLIAHEGRLLHCGVCGRALYCMDATG